METRNYWEENGHVKYDNYNPNDGFGRPGDSSGFVAVPSDDEGDFPATYLKKGKVSRQDPMSHRIIEKRRRDRMNNCLADLSRLIPPEYLKKGRGRVEKTEIIEMAIKHLKFLQDRANAAERQVWGEQFTAGYQEAAAEAMRHLAERGYPPSDALSESLAVHLQRHCDHLVKGEALITPKESWSHNNSHPSSSSETTSSSGSSHGYNMKCGVIIQAPPQYPPDINDSERPHIPCSMDCDRGELPPSHNEPVPLEAWRKREPNLRAVRKPDHEEYMLQSYKFKNCIERRFSKAQDSEDASRTGGSSMAGAGAAHSKRRRTHVTSSISTSASGSTEENSPQSESPSHHYDAAAASQYIPVFALNTVGKYYVPLRMERACVSQLAGALAAVDARRPAPLHPVTIHVNFQPCLDHHDHVKREPADQHWLHG